MEYKIIHLINSNLEVERKLNELGKENWELIQVVNFTYIFKRIKEIHKDEKNKKKS